MLIPALVHGGLNALLLVVDTTGKPSFITRYRIQPDKNNPVCETQVPSLSSSPHREGLKCVCMSLCKSGVCVCVCVLICGHVIAILLSNINLNRSLEGTLFCRISWFDDSILQLSDGLSVRRVSPIKVLMIRDTDGHWTDKHLSYW